MFPLKYWSLFLLVLFAFACEDDNDNSPSEPDIEQGFFYDGPNQTAPVLPGGTYQFAARFPENITQGFQGQSISKLHVFYTDVPNQARLVIWEGDDPANGPGTLIYEESLRPSDIQGARWNEHELNNPVSISGEILWVGIRAVHQLTQQSVGCDAGPRAPEGGDFIQENNTDWLTFQTFASGESINWNIRVELEP